VRKIAHRVTSRVFKNLSYVLHNAALARRKNTSMKFGFCSNVSAKQFVRKLIALLTNGNGVCEVRLYPDAVIRYDERDFFGVREGRNLDVPPGWTGVAGVEEQVHEGLLEQSAVAEDLPRLVRSVGGKGNVGLRKPVLDRTLKYEDPMRFALKVGCLAFDSTRISAADVDFPVDVVLYARNTFQIVEHRFEKSDLAENSNWWQERLRDSVRELPTGWMEPVLAKLRDPQVVPMRLSERDASA